MPRWSRLGPALLVVSTAGCGSDESHSPYIGSGISKPTPPDHTGSKGTGTGGGAAVEDGGGVGTGTLAGTVSTYNDTQFVLSTPFTGTGTIVVRGTHDVTGTFTGPNLDVTDVDPEPSLWVGITATSQAADLVPTIAPVDGTASSVALAFGRASSLALILSASVNTPVTTQSDRAQIVIGFVSTKTRLPLAGVQITQSTGQAVLYDSGNGYSDVFGQTEARGIAVIANASASPQFPGDKVTMTYKSGTTLGTFDVLAAQGAMTIALVPVQQ